MKKQLFSKKIGLTSQKKGVKCARTKITNKREKNMTKMITILMGITALTAAGNSLPPCPENSLPPCPELSVR